MYILRKNSQIEGDFRLDMDDQKDLKLSVIIPTYNRVDYLDRCLKYIERQEHKPLEVLPIVRDYDKLTTDYLKKTNLSINIKPVFLKINYSFVDALNRGMEMASGDIFVFTDDDAFAPSTKWLTVIYDSYKSDDQIAAIGGPVIPFRDDKPIKQYVNIWGKINWYGKMLGETTSIPTSVMECDVIRGANMSYRKSVVREFDKHLLPYWAKNEDAQTFYIKANGGKIITHPDAYVFHQVAPRVMDRASLETIFGYSFNS